MISSRRWPSGVGFASTWAGCSFPAIATRRLACLAGTKPVAGAQHAAVQRLQFFLSESTWSQEAVNARRLELLLADPATAPHPGGLLVVDDSGDGKDGSATAHVGKQYLGSVGKIDRGVVTVTTCWADERVYYPVARATSAAGSGHGCGSIDTPTHPHDRDRQKPAAPRSSRTEAPQQHPLSE
ncbi:transposase [Streptomyces sp. NPDC057565]|uniref:transposase n=1 Tax=Streptomyces sp. NPDC057565 TaxID=3346169 RepID=UPI0036844590